MMPLARRTLIAVAIAAPLPAAHPAAYAQLARSSAAAAAPQVDESILVSADWLASRLSEPGVVIIHVAHDDSYRDGHIPGARELPYMQIVARRDSLTTELPAAGELKATFERLGVSDESRVIVYADHAPMAARVLFSLDYIGHTRWAMLDGGLAQWRAGGHPVSRDVPRVSPGRLTGRLQPAIVATADELMTRIGQPGIALIDTRTDEEYLGTGGRRGMPSDGHLAGARQLQWQWLVREGNESLLRDRAELQRLYAERVRPGDEVVTYCWVGYRASATWFVARYLGYEARMYDGSYQDWMQRRLPVVR